MDWTLSLEDRIARARTDLRLGVPVVLRGAPESVLVLAAEGLTDRHLSAIRNPRLAITDRRADTLRVRVYDGDLARIALPNDVTAAWVASVADPTADLGSPMKGPFATLRDDRAETAKVALMLVKSARLLPAAVLGDAPESFGDLTVLETSSLANALSSAVSHQDVVAGRVPLSVADQARVHVFRPNDATEDHVVCEIGQPSRQDPALVRLHSACFTGDVLGSRKCDCGAQLQGALAHMGQEGQGVLLYLSQEGRGIGLANKLRAYALQDQGFDTVEANHRLGYEDDERDFRTGADILKRLGFTKIRLLTNNPAKVRMMEAHGIEVVERVPLQVGRHHDNAHYLDTKAKKSGHLL